MLWETLPWLQHLCWPMASAIKSFQSSICTQMQAARRQDTSIDYAIRADSPFVSHQKPDLAAKASVPA